MRILHIATLNTARRNTGVMRQMEWELAAAQRLGLDWDVEVWTTDDFDSPVHRKVPAGWKKFPMRRLHFHALIREAAKIYDRIIVRYAPLDLFGPFLPDEIRARCLYVFHTKTGVYLRQGGKVRHHLIGWLDDQLGRRMMRGVGGVVGVTGELLDYERDRLRSRDGLSLIYPNGIDLPDWGATLEDSRGGPLKIIFVASQFYAWNGLEALLEDIRDHAPVAGWELHLVGAHTSEQEAFCRFNGLQDRVHFHGERSTSEIARLLAGMDVSLGAFALHQMNVKEACTLKVRESLGAGVPVYAGHIDCGLPADLGFFRVGPPRINAILNYALDMRSYSREHVRVAGQPYVDKLNLVRSLLVGILNE